MAMEKVTVKVDGMSCEHCVKAVTKVAGELPGVGDVKVSLEAGTAEVVYDPAVVSLGAIKTAIEEQGYDVG
jgi:copper chaperone